MKYLVKAVLEERPAGKGNPLWKQLHFMNKVCNLSIQRVCSFSESREKRERSVTARLPPLSAPQPAVIHWSVQNAFQTTMSWTGRWEQQPLLFPLLPTHWQVVFKAPCLTRKLLHGAGQRCLSEVLPAAPWAAFHGPGWWLPHLLCSPRLLMPRAERRGGRKWAQGRGRKEGNWEEGRKQRKCVEGRGMETHYY